jgi:hypothetical protein
MEGHFFFFVRGLNFVKAELNPKVEGGRRRGREEFLNPEL